jgi:ribosomal protein S27AE
VTAYAFEIRGGTACQRCGVFVTVVMACHHNTRLCNPCAFYEPCARCDGERFEAQFAERYSDDDEEDDEEEPPARASTRRIDDIKDRRLS